MSNDCDHCLHDTDRAIKKSQFVYLYCCRCGSELKMAKNFTIKHGPYFNDIFGKVEKFHKEELERRGMK